MTDKELHNGDSAALEVLASAEVLNKDDVFRRCVTEGDVDGALQRLQEMAASDSVSTAVKMLAEFVPGSVQRVRSTAARVSEDNAVERAERHLS